MPAATKQKYFFTLDHLLETPLLYRAAKTFLQLDPLLNCEATAALKLAALDEVHGNYDDALRAANHALKVEPGNAQALMLRGIIHLQLEQAEEALQNFEQVVSVDPAFQHGSGWTMLGLQLNKMNLCARALPCFEKALQLNPDSRYAQNGYGFALFAQKRYWEAQTFLELALAQATDDDLFMAEIRNNLGHVFLQMNQPKKALHHFSVALKANAKLTDAWCGKALALIRLNAQAAALEATQRALALEPNRRDALCFKATTLHSLERFAEAIVVYDQLLKADDRQAVWWSDRGVALAKTNQFTEALNSCRRSVELAEQEPILWLNYGFVFMTLEQCASAADCFQKALVLKPDYQLAWNNLGMAHLHQFISALRNHDVPQAESHWRQAIESGRKGAASGWHQEEYNFLRQAAATGDYASALRLAEILAGNDLLPPLLYALEYLQTRDLTVFANLPNDVRRQTEKIISQF